MTDQLRTLAEAKSQIAFPVPELHMLKEIRKERRIGYVEGFIAGRTSAANEIEAERQDMGEGNGDVYYAQGLQRAAEIARNGR